MPGTAARVFSAAEKGDAMPEEKGEAVPEANSEEPK
jgi:hypothetical protein